MPVLTGILAVVYLANFVRGHVRSELVAAIVCSESECESFCALACLAAPHSIRLDAQTRTILYFAVSGAVGRTGACPLQRGGIAILVIPPMLISIGITVMAYKNRNQFNEE